jgi:hypothetical protein
MFLLLGPQAEKYAEKESMKLLGWYHVGELVNGAADTAVQQGPVAPSLLSKLVTSMAKGAVDAKQSLKSIIAYSVRRHPFKCGHYKSAVFIYEPTFRSFIYLS